MGYLFLPLTSLTLEKSCFFEVSCFQNLKKLVKFSLWRSNYSTVSIVLGVRGSSISDIKTHGGPVKTLSFLYKKPDFSRIDIVKIVFFVVIL